jgi:hypothetical protein
MKMLKAVFALTAGYIILFSTSLQLSSCTKNQVIRDTVIVRDTTTVRDTAKLVDSAYDLTDGLVAYYNFNGGSLMDSSGYGNNIIFNNATPTSDRFGRPNNAYLFDGSSSYMEITNSPSLNPDNITLTAIVKVNGLNNGACHGNDIIQKGTPGTINGQYLLRFNPPTSCGVSLDSAHEVFFGAYGDDNPQGIYASAGSDSLYANIGQWYFLVYTYDGMLSKFYVNGQLTNVSQKSVVFTDNTQDLFLGKNDDPTFSYFFNGVMDEVRIYNRALSPAAVLQLSKSQN